MSLGPVNTRILKIDPERIDLELVREAAEVIRRGGIVAFPTETVYGLGADTYNSEAAKRVFIAKGRPMDNPLIVHIAELSQLYDVAMEVPDFVERLAKRFWPGPLTLILRKAPRVPPEVTAGRETVAVRMPAHPVALALIRESGVPIAAPSANLAGRPSPTTGEHVVRDLYGRADVIIDSGETLYGVESTIIDVTKDPPVLLRPGAMPYEEVEKELGKKVVVPPFARGLGEADVALAPGMKYRHYAPLKRLTVVEGDYADLESYARKVARVVKEAVRRGSRPVVLCSSETEHVYREEGLRTIVLGPRSNLFIVARNLFKSLRAIDDILEVDEAFAEGFEERGLGLTIMNRLRKASGFNIVKV
ncbi:MAG: L-threonylcarbamoyladenylate synthase [Acidilobus sp.]